jgi:hypothetical protein
MPGIARSGSTWTLSLEFFNEESGTHTDPDTVQLDITFGQAVGFVPDIAGPFFYSGASVNTPGEIWRTGTGQFSFSWLVPATAQTGDYVANWTCGFEGDSFLATENFPVAGGFALPVPAGDVGYWTGSISYVPAASNRAQLLPVNIPLGAVDDNGICWLIQKLDGWDSPDVQGGGVIAKSGDHGGWAAPQDYAPRTLTLTVTASAATQALRDQARALMQQAIPVSDLATLVYNEPIPKQVQFRRSGKITEACPTLTDVTFTAGLICPDPRKYSVQRQTLQVNAFESALVGVTVPFTVPVTLPPQEPGGMLQATNAGSFETRPIVVISGPILSPALTNVTTGQKVSWTGLQLETGDSLSIDFNVAQAFLNGVFAAADLFSSWWVLPPGQASTIKLTGDAGTGAGMAVSWSHAWI